MAEGATPRDGAMVDLPPPDDPQPPGERTRHPFHMHDMIRRQELAVRATLASTEAAIAGCPIPEPGARVLFTGMGSSFHAALATAYATTRAADGRAPEAVDAFDLLVDPERARRAQLAVVFSVSGETWATREAQARLKEAGTPQILVTATPESPSAKLADHVLATRHSDEASWTHTVSYLAALSAGLALVRSWGPDGVLTGAEQAQLTDAVANAVELEPRLFELIEVTQKCGCIVVLGSGAGMATAREAALKLREAAGRFVAAQGIEEFLHGGLPSIGDSTAVFAVSATELERRRALETLRAAERVGALTALFDTSGGPTTPGLWNLPPVRPEMAALPSIVPFQLIAYWSAVSSGRNPDVMGLDDVAQRAARRSFGI